MWKFHVDKSTHGRYGMILGRDLLNALGLNLKFSLNVITGGVIPKEGRSVGINNYNFTSITDKTVKPEESFINSYVEECLESESEISSTLRMCRTLEAKYEKYDLNIVMDKQYQHISSK